MSEPIKICPCGQIPKKLCIDGEIQAKWAYVYGGCCGEWHVEFRASYLKSDNPELMDLATEAWNNSPRGFK